LHFVPFRPYKSIRPVDPGALNRKRKIKKFPETRRLTRNEAARLGVSYGAKRRVVIGVRVTKRTRLYTDRQAFQAKIGTTKEKFSAARIEKRTLKKGGGVVEYKGLSKPQLMKRLRASRTKLVMVKFTGNQAGKGSKYKGKEIDDEEWFSADSRIEADELLDPDTFEQFLEDNDVSGSPRFGLIVYE
jgi:hypothetical protein